MNPVSSRLKAIVVTAAFFAVSSLILLAVIWALDALPVPFAVGSALGNYQPNDTIGALLDLRPTVALTAAFLIAFAIVLVFSSGYLDRMIAIFADVLLMLMAALAGFVAGYWVLLRLAGTGSPIGPNSLQIALICPVLVFAVSLASPAWLRSTLLLRVVAILALLVGAPLLLVALPR